MARNDTILPHSSDGYLTGQLLIATTQIQMSCFHRSVVYMLSHQPEGAMGLIINQPLQHIALGGVLEHFKLEPEEGFHDQPVFFGGPVDTARGFVLHSSEYSGMGTTPLNNALSLTSSLEIIKEIAAGQGPQHKLLALGHAGWGPGQLEKEMQAGSWISTPASLELVFGGSPALKWMQSNQTLGIDPFRLADTTGYA